MTDVILIQPGNIFPNEGFEFKRAGGLWTGTPPLGLAYMAAYIRKSGHSVKIIDLNKEYKTVELFLKFISIESPIAVGITCVTATAPYVKKIAEILKENFPKIKIIIGGPHVNAVKHNIFDEIKDSDFFVLGEGEHTLNEIILNIKNKKPLDKIKGTIYKKGKKIIINELRETIKNLDELPFPARDLLNLDYYINPLNILTSRGCPYGCIYCDQSTFGLKWRPRSAENVYEEIKHISENYTKYLPRGIDIADDSFNIDINRAKKILDLVYENNLGVKLNFGNGLRMNTIDEEFLTKLKRNGSETVFYGIESLDDDVLLKAHKGQNFSIIKRVIELTKKSKIKVGGFFIVDLPGMNDEKAKITIKRLSGLNLDYYGFSFATPYPGTELHRLINTEENYNVLHEDLSIDKDQPFYESKDFTKEEKIALYNKMCSVRNKLILKRYLTPKAISQKLVSIRSLKDVKRIWRHFYNLVSNTKKRYIN
ncbi:MAG: radical SAM protein [Candidatus Nanoarchaeia archaeon]|nr:radical SAM protein [Candidatus Nanoarchaeia archaeon]